MENIEGFSENSCVQESTDADRDCEQHPDTMFHRGRKDGRRR